MTIFTYVWSSPAHADYYGGRIVIGATSLEEAREKLLTETAIKSLVSKAIAPGIPSSYIEEDIRRAIAQNPVEISEGPIVFVS